MEEFLTQLMGKKVDVSCGTGAAVRGEVVDVKNGILYLRDDERVAYVAIEKIGVVWEVIEHEVRTGFVTGKLK
ncbi:MAG TPA: MM0924 family protein [Pyrinomonadaceae bacterium]|nr:MM0924 family protein [Pyrinomonadaceae bacterium]